VKTASELMTIRLDARLRSRLRLVARGRSLTPSAAVRLALESWLADEDARADARPYDQLADLIGCVETRRTGGDASAAAKLRRTRGAGRARRGGKS
jgi:hypothetical protein